MKRIRRIVRRTVLLSAVLGFSSAALAQYRVNQDGHALDANPQMGSNGNNPNNSRNAVNGNDIVTGNVTGGKEFRGNVPYRNSRDFRGSTPGGQQVDDFIKKSSSADPNDVGSSYKVQTFYGTARTVTPPPGYSSGPIGTGGYVPPPAPGTTINREVGDSRMGAVDLGPSLNVLPQPGQLLLPGPVDPTAGQQYISATPLLGIRQFNSNDVNAMGTLTNTQYTPATARLTPQQIDSMRDELNQSGGGAGAGANGQTQPEQQGGGAAPTATPNGATPSLAPGGATGAQPITPQSMAQPVSGATAVNSAIPASPGGQTNQSTRQKLLIPAAQQSAVYAQLLKNHQQDLLDNQDASDADSARAFNAMQRAQSDVLKQQQQKAAGGAATPGGSAAGAPPVPPPAGAKSTGSPPAVPDLAKQNEQLMKETQKQMAMQRPVRKKAEPVKVNSFATGMKGKGLAEVMKNAEQMMKDGKFTGAIDEYDKAEAVAPNNPLIRLGRANAELGASYYARAEAHLREAFNSNPELLNGQYDLSALLGEQRVQTLIRDLKDIMNKEQREPRPVFLLAYIAYNTGHEPNAEAYLDLADKRTGGRDPFYKLLRDNWSLPNSGAKNMTAVPTTQMTK